MVQGSSSPSSAAQSGSGQIGMAAAVSIGIGGMVGAGIFSILGVVAQAAGNAMWLAFAIGGVVALLSTYSYAKLGATFPSAGGAVHFLVKGFGDGIFAGGLNLFMWAGYIISLALYATAFGSYAATFITDYAVGIAAQIAGDRLGPAGDGGECVRRQSHGARRNDHRRRQGGDPRACLRPRDCGSSNRRTSRPRCGRRLNRSCSARACFSSVTRASASSPMRPATCAIRERCCRARSTPAVILVIVLYLAVSLTVTGNLSNAEIERARDYALAEAAKPFLGEFGFRLIAIAALFSTASAINATLFGSANVCYMIARDGELPAGLSRTEWKQATGGLLLTAALVVLVMLCFDLSGIAMMGSAAFLLVYAAVNGGPPAGSQADRSERHDRMVVADHMPRHVRHSRRLHLSAATCGHRGARSHRGSLVCRRMGLSALDRTQDQERALIGPKT